LAVCRPGAWVLRWDLSPLGYLATAGHGHCDALHLSIWFHGQPIVIDPGTGAYHADRPLRDYLASWQAHNGPHPVKADFPQRRGTFLWSAQHERPRWIKSGDEKVEAELRVPDGIMRRGVVLLDRERGWLVEDAFLSPSAAAEKETEVFWQFAPGARLERLDSQRFGFQIGSIALRIECSDGWSTVELGRDEGNAANASQLQGTCSSAFRRVERGPNLLLRAMAGQGKHLHTSFLSTAEGQLLT